MAPTDAARKSGPTRRDPQLLWLAAGLLLVARIALGVFDARNPSPGRDLVPWVPALEAPAQARATGRPIFYDFSAEWCAPCKEMERELFSNERHARGIARLAVPVHVVDREKEDGRNTPTVDSLRRAYGVTGFPTLVVTDADGRLIDKREGFPGAMDFMQWLGGASVKHEMSRKGRAPFLFP